MDEELATCPYDASHRVRRSRLPHHIIKCEKHYKGPKLWICPFNYSHRYPEKLKLQHIATCPSAPVDKPRPLAAAANSLSEGAMTKPKPILQKEYLPDAETEMWD